MNKSNNNTRKFQPLLTQTTAITVTAVLAGATGICILFSDSIIKSRTDNYKEKEKYEYPVSSEEDNLITTLLRMASGEESQSGGKNEEDLESDSEMPTENKPKDKISKDEPLTFPLRSIPLK